jgi:DoxX
MEARRVPFERSVGPPWPRCCHRRYRRIAGSCPAGAAGGRAGVPLEPELAVRLNGAIILTSGVAPALGLSPRLAAGALADSLVPTTLADIPMAPGRSDSAAPAAYSLFKKRRPVRRGAAGAG